MSDQYTINGKLYRLVEEEKKPERLEGWMCRRGFDEGEYCSITEKRCAGDDTRMVEIRDNEVIVSRDDVIKAWENVFKKSILVENAHLKICQELGFKC
jgi:hypothetical protein